MKTKIFFATLLLVLGFSGAASADFAVLTGADVKDVDIAKSSSRACAQYQDPTLYTISVTTMSLKVYSKSFCSDQGYYWNQLYNEVVRLVAGPVSSSCVISEYCNRNVCNRVYGHTVPANHDILLKTDATTGDLQQYTVRLTNSCVR